MNLFQLMLREVLRVGDGSVQYDRSCFLFTEELDVIAIEAVTDATHVTSRASAHMAIASIFVGAHSSIGLIERAARPGRGMRRPSPFEMLLHLMKYGSHPWPLGRQSPQRIP